jgi:ribonuclease P protein component
MSIACVIEQDELGFSKKNRLLLPNEYKFVFKNGRKLQSLCFVTICCVNGKDHARLGLAIAKKNVRLAHDRNRVRRIVRETFRHYQGALKGFDIVVMAQKALEEGNNDLLRQELNKQWQSLVKSFPRVS